ncbi:MAG: hypothetical protein KDB14_18275 [Planctomycetales bacterium]|nr:hypothetical protein [Planctomycetales bacterium]
MPRYTIQSVELLIRTTPPNRTAFHIGGVSGAQGSSIPQGSRVEPKPTDSSPAPAKRRPRGILYAQLQLTDDRGRSAWGIAADRPSFGWLDKRKQYSPDQKLSRLFQLVRAARDVYLADSFPSPFAHWQHCLPEIERIARRDDHESLSAAYASALLERAMIDAVCRLHNVPFFAAMQAGLLGFEASRVAPTAKLALPARPRTNFAIRHTVGLSDPLRDSDVAPGEQVRDGEPESLQGYIQRDGLRYFKVKIGGNAEEDLERLARIWELVARQDMPVITLDGNESYSDIDAFAKFLERLEREQLGLFQHIAFVEQPLTRQLTHDPRTRAAVTRLARRKALVIDEADGHVDAFAEAFEIGYRGVSHKNCKGVFKSLLNAVRVQQAADQGAFQTGEDLSNMPLVSLHQDFVALGLLDIEHCERNGHHYSLGLSHLTAGEQVRALESHGDLYERRGEEVFLKIRNGQVHCSSLQCPGLGVLFQPDREGLTPLEDWQVAW